MKRLLVLGAGTAGTMAVNRLRQKLDQDEWQITVVDKTETHYYQPGFLFIPFGIYSARDVERPRRDFLPPGVDVILSDVDVIEPERNRVKLTDGRTLDYDYLIIATGTHPRPDETPGLEGPAYGDTVHDFYTVGGALNLAEKLKSWDGGRMVVNTCLPTKV